MDKYRKGESEMKGSIVRLFGAICIPYLIYELLRITPYDAIVNSPYIHFYLVSAVAGIATVISIAIGMAGSRLRNIKVIFLALAFISLAGVLTLHGLTTPGFLHEPGQLPGISAQFGVMLASVWLFLSSLSADHVIVRFLSRWVNSIIPIWTGLLLLFCTLAFLYPDEAVNLLFIDDLVRAICFAIIVILNGYTMYSYFQSYRYSKFPMQIAIVYSAGWFIVAEIIIVTGEQWRLSWWSYHLLLLAAMVAMVVGFVRQYGTSRSFVKTIQAMYVTDPGERITNFLPNSVRSLIIQVESRDIYTAGHNFRVALYALRIAEEMGVSPEMRRALVTGAIVHDVGKINIPNEILNKPGNLTEAERKIIESHPVRGYQLCKNLGFMREELGIIRSHHERMDGKGYPDGLQGEQIPFLARIVAVADVYDALTSERAYRQAWSHEEAMYYLRTHKRTHFDPKVVDAWQQACDRDSRVYEDVRARVHLFHSQGAQDMA